MLKVYDWIQDAKVYEDPDFMPVDYDLLIRLLKVALVAINEDQNDLPSHGELEVEWCHLFLHFKNYSRDTVSISKISDLFLRNVLKSNIPSDIHIQILKDIPFSRHSNDAVRLYTATLFASYNIYDMILKLFLNLVPILKSCADSYLGNEMMNTIRGIRSLVSKFSLEKVDLLNRIVSTLVRFIGGSDGMWIDGLGDNLESDYDVLFLKNTYLKESGYGMRQIDSYKEKLLDVLHSHCVFENMEDVVGYTLFAKDVFDQSGNVEIQVILLNQARFLHYRGYYAASATLLEAIHQYFSDSLYENIEKESAQLHQLSTLSFYIQSQDSYNRINDWIDQYFDEKDSISESAILGKLCMALFNPRDKAQENNSFAILNRLSSILGTFLALIF